jgi:hypothetical protein
MTFKGGNWKSWFSRDWEKPRGFVGELVNKGVVSDAGQIVPSSLDSQGKPVPTHMIYATPAPRAARNIHAETSAVWEEKRNDPKNSPFYGIVNLNTRVTDGQVANLAQYIKVDQTDIKDYAYILREVLGSTSISNDAIWMLEHMDGGGRRKDTKRKATRRKSTKRKVNRCKSTKRKVNRRTSTKRKNTRRRRRRR